MTAVNISAGFRVSDSQTMPAYVAASWIFFLPSIPPELEPQSRALIRRCKN
jgi:hypothetical protein